MTISKTKKTSKGNNIAPAVNEQANHNIVMSAMYSGPLPPPAHLEQYEQIIPGSAERFIKMAEKQQDYLHILETQALEAEKHFKAENMKYFSRGQLIALFITLASFALIYLLAIKGHDTLAGIVSGTTIIGLVTAFIYGFSRQKH